MNSFGDVQFYYLGIVLGFAVGLVIGYADGWIRRGIAERCAKPITPRPKTFLERHAEYRHDERVFSVAQRDAAGRS